MKRRSTPFLERFDSKAREFATHEFLLEEELATLELVHGIQAHEAVVFHCARILEVLAREAVHGLNQEPGSSVFGNLELLRQLGRVPTAAAYWAHALRRLGNQARHVLAPISREEADLSTVFVEGWLTWFFCTFSQGNKLPSLTLDKAPLRLAPADETVALMRQVESLEEQDAAAAVSSTRGNAELFRTPALPAVLIEILQSQGADEAVGQLLSEGLQRFPDDPRLNQLQGVQWSRSGQYDQAIECAERLISKNAQDEEALGIAGSVYKRKWRANPKQRDALERSCQHYRTGWRSSGRTNTYLGINVATTLLFLGKVEEAQRIAGRVRHLIQERADRLPGDLQGAIRIFSYWDQVTLAMAEQIVGDDRSRVTYAAASRQYPHRTKDIAITEEQRQEIDRELERGR